MQASQRGATQENCRAHYGQVFRYATVATIDAATAPWRSARCAHDRRPHAPGAACTRGLIRGSL